MAIARLDSEDDLYDTPTGRLILMLTGRTAEEQRKVDEEVDEEVNEILNDMEWPEAPHNSKPMTLLDLAKMGDE